MTIALQLARFVHATETAPGAARSMAVKAVLDLMTAAIVGHGSVGGRAARTAALAIFGKGPAASWFSSDSLTVPGAAFANAAVSSMLDLDDGHRAAAGHPGASIIPAVLAAGEAEGAGAERVLTAIVLGYEVAVRIAAARDLDSLDTLVTGPWCGQGAAAAVAWLRGLPPAEIAQAIAIAGASAPNLAAVGYSRIMGNHVKEGIAWATATGLAAVDLAAAGFTGPSDLFDNARLFEPTTLAEGWGKSWLIETVYFKPYSCCRWAHAAIDALRAVMTEHGVRPGAIQSLTVKTFARALSLNNETAPTTLESAQYSLPFCIALAALRGQDALLPLREASLGDPEVLALAERVRLEVDPDLNALFSRAVPATLVLTTPEREVTQTVVKPRGEADNPMDRIDLAAKLRTASRDLLGPEDCSAFIEAVDRLDAGDIGPLYRRLATPLTQGLLRQVPGLAMEAV